MDPVERYERCKKELERLEAEEQRRQGSEESLLRRLKEEYGLKSLEAAEKDVTRNEKLAGELEDEVNELLDEVEGMQ